MELYRDWRPSGNRPSASRATAGQPRAAAQPRHPPLHRREASRHPFWYNLRSEVFQRVIRLFRDLAVYGLGDIATSVLGFLLLPLFVHYLTRVDYGVWSLLMTVELVAKIVFRWGIDASFMRFYYDCPDDNSRQRLASTLFLFLLVVDGALVGLAIAAAPFVSQRFFGVAGYTLALQLVLFNTFVAGFYFLPFHVLRIQRRSAAFSSLTFARSAATLVVRLALVVGAGAGVMGLVVADTIVTALFTLLLLPQFRSLVRPVFSSGILREALRFGLPRIPHGVAQQVIGPGTDAYLLRLLLPAASGVEALGLIGAYSVCSGLGLGLKLFLSAFEFAWAPFYFQTMSEPDAKRTFSSITTYALGVLVLLAAGLAAVAPELVRLMVRKPEYFIAAPVIPLIAIAVSLQGVYLLTSIGLNITKRTQYYPMATATAAAVNVGANVLLIPRLGILGPPIAGILAYGVLAGVAMTFSQRFYPIAYEWSRLGRIVAAGLAAYAAAAWLPSMGLAWVGLLARGTCVVVLMPVLLWLTGFFRAGELKRMKSVLGRLPFARRFARPAGGEAR